MMPRALLAVDQASVSGYAVGRILEGGRFELVQSGVAKKCTERSDVLRLALAVCDASSLLVVIEDHSDFFFGRGNASVASLLGMGAARGRWEEQLDIHSHPAKNRFKASPGEWRKAVLGLSNRTPAHHAKAEAVRYACAFDVSTAFEHDAAEALCLAVYCAGTLLPRADAEHAEHLADKAGRKAKRAAKTKSACSA
jgi:hypothetical protein